MEAIKELRARTHLGMTACKQALETCAGDVEKAIEHLQKQGTIRRAEELSDAKEGMVWAEVTGINTGVIQEVNCQTDFAARSEVFQNFVKSLVRNPENSANVAFVSKQLGEAIQISRRETLTGSDTADMQSVARAYNHHSGKIAVLMMASCDIKVDPAAVFDFLDECAMQIAANNPLGLNRADVASEEAAQRTIFAEQVPAKAEKMKDKIVQGKVDKWYADVVLVDQESIVHPKKTISQLKNELEVKTGAINLVGFIRYELGH